MKRRCPSFAVLLLLIFFAPLAADEAQPLTARAVADAAAAKPNVDASITYIAENLPKVSFSAFAYLAFTTPESLETFNKTSFIVTIITRK